MKYKEHAKSLLEHMWGEGNVFVREWCVQAGLSKSKVKEMCSEDDEFKEAFELAMDVQDVKLRKMVLDRAVDVGFVKEIMKNEHGWEKDDFIVNQTYVNYLSGVKERVDMIEDNVEEGEVIESE